jgi:hypothetical protein
MVVVPGKAISGGKIMSMTWALKGYRALLASQAAVHVPLTDDQLELMASQSGLYGVRKAAAAYAREVLAASTAPAQSCGEHCSHDYVRSDKVCTECGELVQTDMERKALAAQSCGDAEQADEAVTVRESGVSLLADDHKGMRVDYSGLFKQATASLARGAREPALAEMLRQLKDHITELGTRWYAGDTAVVDEILQLYCVEKDARDTLAARAKDSK